MPAPRRPQRGRRKVKKNIPIGQAHIKTSFNNTIVSLTDTGGNVIAWESAGGDRKSTRLNSSHEFVSRMPSSA